MRHTFFKSAAKRTVLLTLGAALFVVGAVAWSLFAADRQMPTSTVVQPDGWGGDSALADQVANLSPIVAANACGLGASSCFKCHNGARAPKPKADAWHVQHEKVNFSCTGCHLGNPRLMKMQLAHAGLVKDPRTEAAKTCGASCHGSNLPELLKRYQQ